MFEIKGDSIYSVKSENKLQIPSSTLSEVKSEIKNTKLEATEKLQRSLAVDTEDENNREKQLKQDLEKKLQKIN